MFCCHSQQVVLVVPPAALPLPPSPIIALYTHQLHTHAHMCAPCSQPVQQLASGCYNFCRFALLEPGQTSSTCCRSPLLPGTPQPTTAAPPAQVIMDGFSVCMDTGAKTANRPAGSSSSDVAAGSQQQQAAPQQQQHQAALTGLLSQQLKLQPQQLPTSGAQHQSQCQQQESSQAQCDDLQAEAATAGGVGTSGAGRVQFSAADDKDDDLTEAAEEQLMLGNPSSSSHTTTSARCSTNSSTSTHSSSGCGPCWLALPAADPAHLGIWQLGGTAASASTSHQPLMLLQQAGSQQGQTHRGQCMAVVLLQPQVGVAACVVQLL